jgi:hypothetical protein
MGFLLFILTIILRAAFVWVGYVYAIIKLLICLRFKELDKYFLYLAISKDQTANVEMQYLFNDIFILKNGYKFGNEDETISSVLGKNNRKGTFRDAGDLLDSTLDIFEKNHSIKSIEEDE